MRLEDPIDYSNARPFPRQPPLVKSTLPIGYVALIKGERKAMTVIERSAFKSHREG